MRAADLEPAPGELFLDHVGHFTADPLLAARLLETLGFTVDPEGRVLLDAGAIHLSGPDSEHRQGPGLVGFCSPDAESERRRLAARGLDARMPEGRIGFVQSGGARPRRPGPPLQPNEVTALKTVFLSAAQPAETAARWAERLGLLPRHEGDTVRLETARGDLVIAQPVFLEELLGEVAAPPAIAGYALACVSPRALADRCLAAGLTARSTALRCSIVLPAALGGVWLLENEE